LHLAGEHTLLSDTDIDVAAEDPSGVTARRKRPSRSVVRAIALAAVVGLSGCVAHAGATVGIRPGNRTLSFGWQAGAGSYVELLVGQSYATGRAFNYGAVHGWLPARETTGNGNGWDHRETQLGAMLGGGWAPRGRAAVVGADVREFVGAYCCHSDGYRGVAAIGGIRFLGGEAELYVGASAMVEYFGSQGD